MSIEGDSLRHDAVEITQPPTLPASLPVAAPDAGEETAGGEMDNVVPTYGYQQLPVVGLGGSAGGIQALISFFAALPPDATGMAYVVILHLSSEHESTLPGLLQTSTPLPVKAAEDGERLHADHVYVIPPRKHLTLTNDHLRLTPLEAAPGKHVAVDLFFRSLADTHGPHATAIVLSGADSDGAIGIKRVKERGGLTVAQDPGEAEYEGMPRAAILTGMVDWVLPVADMPARLLRYRSNGGQLRLPPEEGPQPAKPAPPAPDLDEQALREVLVLLRTRTGSDFTYYKRATILRRVARRMQITEATTLSEYLAFLRTHPGETGALLQDLLVSVTNFFRDREAFAVVETQIPVLFAGKGPGDTVRVWSAACATGEEAYSLAMLLHEHARRLEHPPTIQVFGCDLDAAAIQMARAGLYPFTIAADVSEERLQRFFTREPRGYRVRRELRETVLFTQHDLLKDAPFSRMDLVSCRNLLIYLDVEAQTRALEIFHFALKPDGRLFLGSAESVDEEKALFSPLDKKHCLLVRRAAPRVRLPVPTGTGTLLRALQAQTREVPVAPPADFVRDVAPPFALPPRQSLAEEQARLAELHYKLTEHYAPPSLVVNAEGNIVHLSENVGRFLRLSGGQLTTNFLQTVLPALRMDLRAALLRMEETHAPAEVHGVAVKLEGGVSRLVDLRVAPAAALAPGYVLVSFAARVPDATAAQAAPGAAALPTDAEAVVRHLERELEAARVRLRDTVEHSRASEEEYRSSNEELQSMNEELRSASEELETSREELQSLNEELTTVNHELKHNVGELGHANSDLHNLMAATNIATVFLDRELKVLRYTPSAVTLFNLIPTDVGRPLGDLKHRIDYPELEADARQVLAHLVPVEREVGQAGNGWFLARLQPYRSLDDHIAGVVLTFVDITARRQAEEALRQSEKRAGWQKEAFQTAVNGAPLGESLSLLTRAFTNGSPGEVRGAFYIADKDSTCLHPIPGASDLPDSYQQKIDGFLIGMDSLACGLAIPTGSPVLTRDVLEEPLWQPWMGLAQEYGFRGCWSFPIMTRDNQGVGVFALYFREPREASPDDLALADVVTQAAAIILSQHKEAEERARAEAALRESEEKYRSLFEGIDEGFLIHEIIRDEAGRATDLRLLEINPAFTRQTGLGIEMVGKLNSEFLPGVEQFWLDTFDRVARTGTPERIENYNQPTGRWYNVHVSRAGRNDRQVSVLFDDVTERKRAEQTQAFLLKLGDASRPLRDPAAMQEAAMQALGTHLGVHRAFYGEVLDDADTFVVGLGYTHELPPLAGRFKLTDFDAESLARCRAGRTVVINDLHAERQLSAQEQQAFAAVQVQAAIAVPLVKDGRLRAILSLHYAMPRRWTEAEVALAEETAERTWAAVERAQAETALREREGELARVQRIGEVGGVDIDIAGGFTSRCSPEYLRLHGLPPGAAAYENHADWLARVHPADRDRADAALHDALAGTDNLYESEYRIVRPDNGQTRWIKARADIERDPAGKPVRLVGAHLDVTEQKRLEDAIRETEERQRFLLRLSDAFRARPDVDAMAAGATRLLAEHLGLDRCWVSEVFEPQGVSTVGPEHLRPDLAPMSGTFRLADYPETMRRLTTQPMLVQDVANDSRFSESEKALLTGFGLRALLVLPLRKGSRRVVWALAAAMSTPRRWTDGERVLLEEVAERTWAAVERAKAEQALRESEERLQVMAANLPGGAAFIVDRDLRYQLAEGEALRQAGFRPEDLVGKTIFEALPPELATGYEPFFRQALAGEPFTHEHFSHERTFVTRGAPLRGADGGTHAVLAVSYDITERKRAEETLRAAFQETEQARAEAVAAGAAKDHFMAVLSHELRTPLMPITMALALLGKRQDIPEPVRKAHEMIKRNVELEGRFIDDLLDVTRIARGKMEIVRVPMDLHTALERAVEVAAADLHAKQQGLTVELEATGRTLSGDLGRLQQVFWNLLKNAAKFTPEGGAIQLRSRNDAGHILVEVTDSGIGMEAGALGRIFAPFEQANVSIAQEFGGLGLGLAIAKATVEAHGGTIRAASAGLGQGATFTVSLPVKGDRNESTQV